MGKVMAVCISEKKGEQKHPVERIRLRVGVGIEGDAHAGGARDPQVGGIHPHLGHPAQEAPAHGEVRHGDVRRRDRQVKAVHR